ncbi:hypothetical protein ALQ20_101811 [Pseudomonas syringae pv. atrofaciens]|nr:hypothetical protein ALQ20_101811 [Pseudomonas syringae pv. atrofaciens]
MTPEINALFDVLIQWRKAASSLIQPGAHRTQRGDDAPPIASI